MLNQPRLDEIMRLLAQQQRVKASDLAQLLFVSEETIRRDFKHLEEEGRLRRIHGGAILPRSSEELPLQGAAGSNLAPRPESLCALRNWSAKAWRSSSTPAPRRWRWPSS